MKKLLTGMLILSFIFAAGCHKAPDTEPPFTETTTHQGIVITTPYFSFTLPSAWQNNYTIRYSADGNDRYYRLVDPVCEETHGGHYFTVALYEDPVEAAEICGYNGTYLGVLQGDIIYSAVVLNPTDLPVPDERADLYRSLHATKQQALDSFAPAKGTTFLRTGAQNYQQRAVLLSTPTRAKEVAERFAKETDTPITYVGLCTDLLTFEENGQTLPREHYAHYLYEDEAGTHYVIPLFFASETQTVLPTVYRVDAFPHVTQCWAVDHTEFDRLTRQFLADANMGEGEYLLKDLDGEGIPELVVRQGTTLSVYVLKSNAVAITDQYDSETATMSYYEYYGLDHPGLFTRHVGGGQTHYGYLRFENNQLRHQIVVTKNTPDPTKTAEQTAHSDDQALVDIATKDLPKVNFLPFVS